MGYECPLITRPRYELVGDPEITREPVITGDPDTVRALEEALPQVVQPDPGRIVTTRWAESVEAGAARKNAERAAAKAVAERTNVRLRLQVQIEPWAVWSQPVIGLHSTGKLGSASLRSPKRASKIVIFSPR